MIEPDEHSEVAERHLRVLEALLFASNEPLDANSLLAYLGEGADIGGTFAKIR